MDDCCEVREIPREQRRTLQIVLLINVVMFLTESVAGVLAHSTALFADAAHHLGDVLGRGMAWGATVLAQRARTLRPELPILLTTGYAELPGGVGIPLPRLTKPYQQAQLAAAASSSSSVSPRVRAGSTRIPGPIVVVKVIFLR